MHNRIPYFRKLRYFPEVPSAVRRTSLGISINPDIVLLPITPSVTELPQSPC